ncbi:hypothetical protein [Burkholderia sp. MSMB2157WGS]|uniref:hypothetical protein n=1 Tax=Burkholderia sp. MSMB2157WGS TaxID=1637928 RepID=UPI0007568474|nr:hypothetical protein [Burkholderia sp. MSMB2157WGS]KWE63318.1 hypothetical protein WT53_06335 [Burkholderia sp. MSMB2157WGS]
MRILNDVECRAASGGLSTSTVLDWINNLVRPSKPSEPWVNPFPADNQQIGAVEAIGKFVAAVGIAVAVTGWSLIRNGGR